jgi:hypothetical protein
MASDQLLYCFLPGIEVQQPVRLLRSGQRFVHEPEPPGCVAQCGAVVDRMSFDSGTGGSIMRADANQGALDMAADVQ